MPIVPPRLAEGVRGQPPVREVPCYAEVAALAVAVAFARARGRRQRLLLLRPPLQRVVVGVVAVAFHPVARVPRRGPPEEERPRHGSDELQRHPRVAEQEVAPVGLTMYA